MTAQGMRGERLLSGGERFAAAPGVLGEAFARLLAPGFQKVLDAIDRGLENGSLRVHLPDGTTRTLGGRRQGFDVEVWLKDWRALIRLATNGSVGSYQGYEAGEWEADDHSHLFALFSSNARTLGTTARSSGLFRWVGALAHRLNRNSKAGAVRNISAHYDLGNDFYESWLGDLMSYSSALFAPTPEPSSKAQFLDELRLSQLKKMTAIANRASPPVGGRVLEIGCGWGSQALIMAGAQDVAVDAISLSDEQLDWCRYRRDNSPQELFGEIAFRKQDYRDVGVEKAETYDAIVSVEMVEALGREFWPDFMDCLVRNLKPGGRAALQYISMADDLFETYAETADFIQAYIFPGGLLIKTSEFRRLAEERGLSWHDQVNFGADYARTLRIWRERFDLAIEEGRLPQGFDERFARLWRYYLSYCEGGFLGGNIDVHQVTLIKDKA